MCCSQNESQFMQMRGARGAQRRENPTLGGRYRQRGPNQPTKQGESTADKVELFLCQTLQNILSHRSRKQCWNHVLLCQQLESMQCWLQSKLVDEHSLMARKMLLLKKNITFMFEVETKLSNEAIPNNKCRSNKNLLPNT